MQRLEIVPRLSVVLFVVAEDDGKSDDDVEENGGGVVGGVERMGEKGARKSVAKLIAWSEAGRVDLESDGEVLFLGLLVLLMVFVIDVRDVSGVKERVLLTAKLSASLMATVLASLRSENLRTART